MARRNLQQSSPEEFPGTEAREDYECAMRLAQGAREHEVDACIEDSHERASPEKIQH